MPAPRQMTAHTLEGIKGWPNNLHAVDFDAKLSPNVTIDPVFAGRCVHVNSVGDYEMGLPDIDRAGNMAIFIFQNSDDPDVSNPGGITGSESDEPGGFIAIAPAGAIMGLVAIGGYELESTEFEPEASLGSIYEPGDTLTATADNASAVTGGRITKGVAYDVPLCGVVSRGVFTNSHTRQALAFWPVFLPRNLT